MTVHFQSRLALLVVLIGGLALIAQTGAQAGPPGSLTVTRFDDPAGAGSCPSDCSLRQALAAIAPGGTVTLPAGTYTLTQGQLDVAVSSLTINGAGARQTTIEQTTGDRVLEIGNSATTPTVTLTMSGVTIDDGNASSASLEDGPASGGGIFVAEGGTLDLSQSSVTTNTAFTSGGGIAVAGALNLDSSLIANNAVDETTSGDGGGVYSEGSSATITNTTIYGNYAVSDGGGIYASDAISLTNDTLDSNSSGGGTGTGDDVGVPSNVTAVNTIFSGGPRANCDSATGGGNVVSLGHNISSDANCANNGDGGDQPSTNPMLGPLQNNGGPTNTEAPAPGSPAIGAAIDSDCTATDQRGVTRTAGACTIGAVEGAGGPIIQSRLANNIFDITADAGGDIDPNGADTTFEVEYGTTTAYGQQSGMVNVGLTAGVDTQTLTGLSPSTTYHFRVDATNANGTAESTDGTFTTGPQITGTAGTLLMLTNYDIGALDGCPATVTLNWGDGSPADTVTPSCVSGVVYVTDSHTYSAAGHYDVTISTFHLGAQISVASGGSAAQAPPDVTAEAVQVVTGTSATVSASIRANGDTTSYIVQYGPTSSYGHQTTAASAGSGTSLQQVTATITGLTASSTYHFRFVATNSGGTTNGADGLFITTTGGTTDLTSETPPPPIEGVFANLLPFRGTVLVNGEPLLVGEQIPFGAIIDATHGTVVLVTVDDGVTQEMQFSGGIFKVTQLANGITLLVLQGGNFSAICGTPTKTIRLAGPRTSSKPIRGHAAYTVRSLWGNGKGHFEVKGRYAAATVRGTIFHVADRCDGTLVHVRRGIVAVLNLVTNKTTTLTVGKSYLAPAKP